MNYLKYIVTYIEITFKKRGHKGFYMNALYNYKRATNFSPVIEISNFSPLLIQKMFTDKPI